MEKKKLESFLGMGGGFVMNFSNYEFNQFIQGCINVDVYDSKYDLGSGSKANRLRKLWDVESNQVVAKLLEGFAEYWMTFIYPDTEFGTSIVPHDNCLEIAARLKTDKSIEDADAIKANGEDEDFEKLAQSVREDIIKDQPDVAMDRLHTFVGKYFRCLCDKHGISYDNYKPLNSIFGGYVKHLRENKLVESEMALKILHTSISVLEHFNDVRNNKSFAHPNTLLNYDESLLIFKYITGLIKFLDTLELKMEYESKTASSEYAIVREIRNNYIDNLPF